MNRNNNKGITLIALIITIIILLILAGISIATLSGENGLLKRASNAKHVTEVSQEKELLQEETYHSYDKKGNLGYSKLNTNVTNHIPEVTTDYDATNGDFPLTVTFTTTGNIYEIDEDGNVGKIVTIAPITAVGENTKYKDENDDIAVIPKGFRISDHQDSNEEYDEQTIETGLVVKDGANNEWVWVPVPDVTALYTTTGAPYTLCGTSGATAVTTNKASKSEILNGQTRTTPGTTADPYFREPDLIIGNGNGNGYDNADGIIETGKKNYEIAGFSSLTNMAQSLASDYNEMLASVGKYKGFYVGKYELTGSLSNPTEVSGSPITSAYWYQLYKACKEFTTNEVESRMIWGCQWDAIMLWMLSNGNTASYVTDSRSKGQYSGSKINTGSNKNYEVNKIYDLAGNCWEWTQEAATPTDRIRRGRCRGCI